MAFPLAPRLPSRTQMMSWLVVLVAVGVLGATVFWTHLRVERAIRDQIVDREGEILNAVAQMRNPATDSGPPPDLSNPAEQLGPAFRISQLKGVLGFRLFSPEGKFNDAEPAHVREGVLSASDLSRLQSLKPVSRFYPAQSLGDVFYQLPSEVPGAGGTVPLLEVEVPLPDQSHSRLAGVIQFIIEGNSVAEEYEQLDHTLAWEAWVAFAVGAALLTATLGWTFRRLAQRTADLQRANQELTMAAKTSALGAVTAHLIHQLKNPLFGLQQFVESQGSLVDMESERQDATAAARRMQAMVNTVIGVLRDEKSGAQYELSLDELAGTIKTRTHDAAAAKGVRLTVACVGEATLPARSVNLMILILVNLIENAIQATPSGGTVRFAATASASGVECEVCDEGPGLPAELAESLFSPHPSAKPGGTGIGLAISKQLANHLGASLDLKGTSAAGCVFRLRLPRQ